MAPSSLNFITGNRNKLVEVQTILKDVIPLTSQSLDLVEIQGTIEEICKDKCERAAAIVGDWFTIFSEIFSLFLEICLRNAENGKR